MTNRYLLRQAVVVSCLLLAANYLVALMGRNSIPRQKIRLASEAKDATDIFLGNSTMEAGIDLEAYQGQVPQSVPLNLGIGWTSPIEHMLIFSKLSSKPGRRVFYGFVGTQLTDVPRSDVASLTGNRAMVYYANPDLAMRLMGIRDWFTLTKFQVLSSIAAFVERDRIWAKVERVRRRLGAIGLPAVETNRFGRVTDFDRVEGSEGESAQNLNALVAKQVSLIPAICEMLDSVQREGGQMYVVEMPRPTRHRGAGDVESWSRYREHLANRVRSHNAIYVDASGWVSDDGFADSLHLNAAGATIFTARLAEAARSAGEGI